MDAGLRHLKHLVAAEQHGSFRRAAEALDIRQSTLSRGIKQFEDGLGVPLFVRSTGGVRPTPAGSQFIETAKRLLADFEASVSTARALGRGSIGRLALGLGASRVSFALHGLLRDYAHEFPDVTIQLVVKSRIALLSDLDVGRVDLAVVGGSITSRDYESLSLWPERIVIAASQDAVRTLRRVHRLHAVLNLFRFENSARWMMGLGLRSHRRRQIQHSRRHTSRSSPHRVFWSRKQILRISHNGHTSVSH